MDYYKVHIENSLCLGQNYGFHNVYLEDVMDFFWLHIYMTTFMIASHKNDKIDELANIHRHKN